MTYPWAYSDPIDGQGMDDEDRGYRAFDEAFDCKHCGQELDYEECDYCGGEGFIDGERLQEEDPLWYDADDTERCEQCSGKGGWHFCTNRDCSGKRNDLQVA